MRIKNHAKEVNDIPLRLWLASNSKPLLFIVIFMTGILIGSMISSRLSAAGFYIIDRAMQKFIADREDQAVLKTFLNALLPNLTAWAAIFISGFCAISAPVTALIPCARGILFGIQSCSLMMSLSYAGVKYISLHMLPNLMISAVTLSLCCCDSLAMSRYFWQAIDPISRIQNNSKITASLFCGKMLVYALVISFGAITEAYSYTLFG